VAATVNGMLTGASDGDDIHESPLKHYKGQGNAHHFLNTGLGAMPLTRLASPWSGDYVYNSGDLILDLFAQLLPGERGADEQDPGLRDDRPSQRSPDARLPLCARGVHALAYAKALEELTGVDVKKMLPIPAVP
jgi:Mn-containing catalase